MEKHQEDFKNMKAALLQEGYKEKDVTFTAKKATLLGLLYSLPFIAILGLIYRFLLVGRAHLTEITGASFYLTFFAIIIISTVIHELLHGFGWAFSSGHGWKAVRFNINALMPSCACRSALEKFISIPNRRTFTINCSKNNKCPFFSHLSRNYLIFYYDH